jgi:hypothetical protein
MAWTIDNIHRFIILFEVVYAENLKGGKMAADSLAMVDFAFSN